MTTIREISKELDVSYEAVRKKIKRYSKELDGHIIVDHRTQYLDDFATEFLKAKGQDNPVVVYNKEKDEQIKKLRQEKTHLLTEIAVLQKELLEKSEALHKHELKALQESNQKAELQAENQELKETLEMEKNRKLTLSERILGRKKK